MSLLAACLISPVLSSQPPGLATLEVIPQKEQEPFHPHDQPEDVQNQGTLRGGVATSIELERRVEHAVQARQQDLDTTENEKKKKKRETRVQPNAREIGIKDSGKKRVETRTHTHTHPTKR